MNFMKRCYCFCFSLGLLCSVAVAAHSILNSFKMTLLWLISKAFFPTHHQDNLFYGSCIYFLINSLWYLFLLSVLGTFAAMYLTVKYHMRPVHEINLSPLYSSGWVWSDGAFKFSRKLYKRSQHLQNHLSSCRRSTNRTVILKECRWENAIGSFNWKQKVTGTFICEATCLTIIIFIII